MHVIAKSSLCFAIDGEDLKIAATMAYNAVRSSLQPGVPFNLPPKDLRLFQNVNPFFLQSLGMAEYRSRHFKSAIDLLTLSRDHVYVYRDVIACFYIAMAAAELQQYEEARSFLDDGNRLWQSSAPKPGKDDLEQFEDWILCDQARREAIALVPAK